MVVVKLAGEAGGGVAIVHAQLPPRAVAVGVDRRLGHAELPGDLLGGQVLVDKPQALALTRRKKRGWIVRDIRSCAHNGSLNDELGRTSTLRRKVAHNKLHSDA
jgi:hypothetical protein